MVLIAADLFRQGEIQNGIHFVQTDASSAVPDAMTLSDRLYRKLFRNRGGHVNLFGSETELTKMLGWYFGLSPAGSRTLCASLTFLNRRARNPDAAQLRIPSHLPERLLLYLTWLLRAADLRFGARPTIYGWALYFGNIRERADPALRTNIGIRCDRRIRPIGS